MSRLLTLSVAVLSLAGTAGAAAPSASIPAPPPIAISDPGAEGVRVAADGVFANYFAAKGPGPHPAILVLGGSEGGLGPAAAREAKALQLEGYSVLQVCYFGCPGTPERLADVPLETFSRALAWLRAQPGVDPERVGAMGGSKGAEAVLLAATRDPRLKAVVATMPSSVVWPGITYSQQIKASWTEGGTPLPYLPYALSGPIRSVFDLYNSAVVTLANRAQHPDADIPVERVAAPLLLVCGEADTLWPSCPMSDQIAQRLQAKGRPAPTILRYPDAGHAVFGIPLDPANPTYNSLAALGGTADGNNAARRDAWPKALAFLAKTLKP